MTPGGGRCRRQRQTALYAIITLMLIAVLLSPVLSQKAGGTGDYTQHNTRAADTLVFSAWIQPWEKEGVESLWRYREVLDEVSPYWYWTLPNGTIVPTSNATENTSFVQFCRERSIDIVPMISNLHNPETIRLIVKNSTAQKRHIRDLLNITLRGGYRGLDINYESLYTEDREFYVNFIGNLTETFHQHGKVVYVSVFPKTSEADNWYGPAGYNYSGLGEKADYIKIMAYNLHWSTCNTSGPITSYKWVDAVLSYATEVIPRGKIILGIPLFGYDWPIWPDGRSRGTARNCSYGEIMSLQKERGLKRLWNPLSRTPYFIYTDDSGVLHALHYSDAESLLNEMNLVKKYSINGISIWKLGGEDPNAFRYLKYLKENSLNNLPPYVDVRENITGMRGVSVQLGPVRAYDVDGTLKNIWWDFGDGEGSNILEPAHIYLKGGFYTATLHLVDSGGISFNVSTEVKIAPYSNFTMNGTFLEGETISFNATSSWDPYGIVSYTWYFGDGTFLFHARPVVKHEYKRPGEYTITLVVIDSLGFVDICNRTIVIPDCTPPRAIGGEDLHVWEDSWVTLDGRESEDNGEIVNYTWVVDGVTIYGAVVRYYFEEPGQYTATLTVRDRAGLVDSRTINIYVRDRTPPEVHLTYPRRVKFGEMIVLDASSSTDNVGIVNYTWHISGFGMVYSRKTVTFNPPRAGRYFFTLDVLDAEGNWNSTTVFIDVYDDEPPEGVYTISPRPRSLKETYINEALLRVNYGVPEDLLGAILTNLTYRFEVINLRDESGISTITWSFGDGTRAGGNVVYHNFTEEGYYHILLLVTDTWGNTRRFEFTLLALPSYNITLLEIPPPQEPEASGNVTENVPINTTIQSGVGRSGKETTPPAPEWVWLALTLSFIALFIVEIFSLILRGGRRQDRGRMKLLVLLTLLLLVPNSILLIGTSSTTVGIEEPTRGGYPPEDGGDPKRFFQYRGMWMDGYDIVNISEVRKTVAFARDHHINCLSPLINGNYNGVYYNSTILPKHVDVAPGFDPLMALITEAHKYGIQVHPWVHTLYNPPVVNMHPEWACVSYWGNPSRAWLNPSLPEVRSFLLNMTLELVTNYPLDGIKFDTLRYGSYYYSYDNYSLSKFQQEGGGDFNAWRREEINEVVEMLYDAIMEVRPYMWVGADVWRDYNSWRTYLFQESREWARRGKIDYLCVMDYTTNEASFKWGIEDYLDNSYRVPIVAGPYVFTPDNHAHGSVPNETVGIQILLNETSDALNLETMGVAFFSYKFFKKYPSYAQALLQGPLAQEALCPLKNQTHPVKTDKWEFNKFHDREGWRLTGAGHYYPSGGFWTIASSSSPAIMSPLVNFTSDDINVLEISLKCDSPSGVVNIYWSHNWTRFSEPDNISFQLKPDRSWHLYSIHLDRNERWRGTIRYLKLAFSFPEPTNITIDFVRLYWMPDCIQSWAILGPFTTGGDEGLLERDFTGCDGDMHPRVGDVTAGRVWRLFSMKRDLVDLRFAYGNVTYTAIYAHVYIRSPSSQTVQLRVGSSDSIRVWLNDEEVITSPILRWVSPDQNLTQVKLKEGMNSLTLKLAMQGNATGFFVRFTTLQNESVEGLEYYADLPPIPPPILNTGLSGWSPVKSVNVSWKAPSTPTEIIGYEWSIDGGEVNFTPNTSLRFENLSQGIHLLKVNAVDEYGFRSPSAETTIMLDWTVPLISTPKPSHYYLSSPGTINWTWKLLREPISGISGYYINITYNTPDNFYCDYAVRGYFTRNTFFELKDKIFDGLYYNISVTALSYSGLNFTSSSTQPVIVDYSLPTTPNGLKLSHITNTTRYVLSWNSSLDDLSGVVGYEVWMRVGTGEWELYASAKTNHTTVERPLHRNVTFKVRASDRAGHWSTFSETISPGNLPPVASIHLEGAPNCGMPLTFSSVGSYDPDGIIVSRYWLLDGVPWTDLEVFTVTLTEGVHTVGLVVKDDMDTTRETRIFVNVSSGGENSFSDWLVKSSVKVIYPPPSANETEEEENPTSMNNTTSFDDGVNSTGSVSPRWGRFFVYSIILLLIASIGLSAVASMISFREANEEVDEDEVEMMVLQPTPSTTKHPSPISNTVKEHFRGAVNDDKPEDAVEQVYIRPSPSRERGTREEVFRG